MLHHARLLSRDVRTISAKWSKQSKYTVLLYTSLIVFFFIFFNFFKVFGTIHSLTALLSQSVHKKYLFTPHAHKYVAALYTFLII